MIPLKPPTDISLAQVKATNTYKNLNFIGRKLTVSPNNVKAIDNGIKSAKEIGIEKWKNESNSGNINKLIVEELCTRQG